MTDDLIARLRALSRHEHSDMTIGDEAADALATMRKDVERYHWLRQWDVGINHEGYGDYTWYGYAEPYPKFGMLSLDAAIDAARKEGDK